MSTIKIHCYAFTDQEVDDGVRIADKAPHAVVVEVPDDTRLCYVTHPNDGSQVLTYVWRAPDYEMEDERARGRKFVRINGVRYKAVEE